MADKGGRKQRPLSADESANFGMIRADMGSWNQDERRRQFLDATELRAAGLTAIDGDGTSVSSVL